MDKLEKNAGNRQMRAPMTPQAVACRRAASYARLKPETVAHSGRIRRKQQDGTAAVGCSIPMEWTSGIRGCRNDLRFVPKVFLIDAGEVS
jgi:hypothetical protein